MKALALIFSIIAFAPFSWASNPRGDDLTVANIVTVTHDFELSTELRTKAIEAREKILKEVRFGVTRTNPASARPPPAPVASPQRFARKW